MQSVIGTLIPSAPPVLWQEVSKSSETGILTNPEQTEVDLLEARARRHRDER